MHDVQFLETLAAFQINRNQHQLVVTFLFGSMWEEKAIDYMRLGEYTHTHTLGGEWALGLWLQRPAPVKRSVCGGRGHSGAFLLRSLCVSSKESNFTETQSEWKKEGK